jgi:PEP-CTERM motif
MHHALRRSVIILSAFLLWVGLPASARSQTVLFDGGFDSNNCFPFGCFNAGGRYQQIYSSSLFSSAVLIQSLTFFNDETFQGGFRPGDYTIRLSTTTSDVNSLSNTFDDNLGSDAATIFSGGLGGGVSFEWSFFLTTPFFFDPGAGNLLLDVVANNITDTQDYFFDAFQQSSGQTVGRVLNTSSGVTGSVNNGFGLVTEFEFSEPPPQPAVVPEPISMVLLGTGLLGLGAASLRRRRKERLA